MSSLKTDADLSLVEQINLEKEMGTYFVRFTTVKVKSFLGCSCQRHQPVQPKILLAVWPSSLFPASAILLVVLFIQLYSALDQETDNGAGSQLR